MESKYTAERMEREARAQSYYGGGSCSVRTASGKKVTVYIAERYNSITGKVSHVPVWTVNGIKVSRAKALAELRA